VLIKCLYEIHGATIKIKNCHCIIWLPCGFFQTSA